MSGVESYPYPVKEGQRYINLNPGCLFVQQPPKKEKRSSHAYTHNNKRRSASRKADFMVIVNVTRNIAVDVNMQSSLIITKTHWILG